MFALSSKCFPRSSAKFMSHSRMISQTAALNRVAVVTGASGGIGRAIALRLANDGYDVALSDLPSAKTQLQELVSTISKTGVRTYFHSGNVSAEADVKGLIATTTENLGSVDVMIANAGICFMRPVTETSVEDWDKIFRINTRGIFLCYKYAAEQMIKQGHGGRIIGASSIAGKRGQPNLAGYCSTKFAVRGLTQSAAQEWAKYGITVNAYAPGPIETPMLDIITTVEPGVDIEPTQVGTAVGFVGKPEDVAGIVSYLASDQARFVTGQAFTIDGGMVFD